ncbi:hypothetical protein Leryth_024780 [Lithospermum erythrorhizon]|nr:hypothetical protein Leryth_024780 [Lithospermum erythrorhizon]
MKHKVNYSDDDQSSDLNKKHCWWRTCEKFGENGELKMDLSDLSKLTPELKILREMERTVAEKALLVKLDVTGVLGRSGLIPFAQISSGSRNVVTLFLEEMRSGFCVYDTRGFDCGEMGHCLEELSSWMEDGVRHNQPCLRPGDEKLHKMALTSSFNGKAVEATKDIFHCPSLRNAIDENPILILTHGDLLNSGDRISSRVKICEYLGISEITGSYDIACVTDQGILPEELDPVTAFSVTEQFTGH